jgi:hypothetical protein
MEHEEEKRRSFEDGSDEVIGALIQVQVRVCSNQPTKAARAKSFVCEACDSRGNGASSSTLAFGF